MPDKVGNEGIIWTGVNTLGAFNLLNIALVHDRDPIRDGQRLLLIVGHVYGSDTDLFLDFTDRLAHLDAQLCIEVGERLVHQKHLRLHNDGARQRDALLLAAGELVGIAILVLRDLHGFHDLFHTALDLVLGELFVFQTVLDVAVDGHVREDGVALEHHAEIALIDGYIVDHLVVKRNGAGLNGVKTGDHAEKRCFAAAARPKQREQLAGTDVDGQVADDDVVLIRLFNMVNMNCDSHECTSSQ